MAELVPGAMVTNNYSMTEAGTAFTYLPPGELLRRPGSVGMPLPPTEIRIADDAGEPMPTGEVGEVLIGVGEDHREYYGDPEATARTWSGPWLRSGDLGRIDEDGYLYIVGRAKDVVIRGGNNIGASEVENALYEHPGVLEAAVVGVPARRAGRGRRRVRRGPGRPRARCRRAAGVLRRAPRRLQGAAPDLVRRRAPPQRHRQGGEGRAPATRFVWRRGRPDGAGAELGSERAVTALETLAGTRVLVTGASSGIGAALAPMLAARGATVGVVARRTDRLAEVLARCEAAGPDLGHRAWTVDLSDVEAAAALGRDAWDAFGGLEAVVNNAAIPMRRGVAQLDLQTVEAVMRTNYLSPVALSLAVLPSMLDRDQGVIVNVSSLGGRLGIANEAAYVASKFALSGWSEAMAMDLWSTGVEVRLVTPGAIDTEIWDQAGNEPAHYDGPLEPPTTVAAAICDAMTGDRFETYVPDMQPIAEFKTSDIDAYLSSAVMFMTHEEGGP